MTRAGRWRACVRTVLNTSIRLLTKYGGRLVKLTGDGALVEFASAVDALSAAIEFQQAMAEANGDQPADTALVFRMGLHLGDLIVDGDDLYGDGVNVAARLEAEAPAGGIVISRNVHDAVDGPSEGDVRGSWAALSLKNIERPVQAFSVKWEPSDWQAGDIRGDSRARDCAADAAAAARQALHRRAAVPEHERRSRAGIFRRRHGRGHHHRAVALQVAVRHRPQLEPSPTRARRSTFKQVGRELGVRYVLEGSVRKAGNRVRITGQLIDASNGAHLWADRFDGELEDIFDLQDQSDDERRRRNRAKSRASRDRARKTQAGRQPQRLRPATFERKRSCVLTGIELKRDEALRCFDRPSSSTRLRARSARHGSVLLTHLRRAWRAEDDAAGLGPETDALARALVALDATRWHCIRKLRHALWPCRATIWMRAQASRRASA